MLDFFFFGGVFFIPNLQKDNNKLTFDYNVNQDIHQASPYKSSFFSSDMYKTMLDNQNLPNSSSF